MYKKIKGKRFLEFVRESDYYRKANDFRILSNCPAKDFYYKEQLQGDERLVVCKNGEIYLKVKNNEKLDNVVNTYNYFNINDLSSKVNKNDLLVINTNLPPIKRATYKLFPLRAYALKDNVRVNVGKYGWLRPDQAVCIAFKELASDSEMLVNHEDYNYLNCNFNNLIPYSRGSNPTSGFVVVFKDGHQEKYNSILEISQKLDTPVSTLFRSVQKSTYTRKGFVVFKA